MFNSRTVKVTCDVCETSFIEIPWNNYKNHLIQHNWRELTCRADFKHFHIGDKYKNEYGHVCPVCRKQITNRV